MLVRGQKKKNSKKEQEMTSVLHVVQTKRVCIIVNMLWQTAKYVHTYLSDENVQNVGHRPKTAKRKE